MLTLRNLIGLLAAPLALVVALPAAVLALPFLGLSGLVRAVERLVERDTWEWHELIDYEPEIGWKPRAGIDGYHEDLAGDVYRIETGPDGWRGSGLSVEDADLVVFGDSYAFGNAIDEEDFFANLSPDVRIKAIGAPGYNMVQELLLMREFGRNLAGKLVVWLVYPGNDLEDNLSPESNRYRTPFVREDASGGWEIVTEHVSREEWPFSRRRPNYERMVEICTPSSYLSRRAFAAAEYLIREGAALCGRVGARLAVVSIPDLSPLVQEQIGGVLEDSRSARESFAEDLPDRELERICEEAGLAFVPLAEHLSPSDYRRRDVHWTRSGHRRVGRVLVELYRDAGEGAAGPPGDRDPGGHRERATGAVG